MNLFYLRLAFVTIIFGFPPCLNGYYLSMKVKKTVYEFLSILPHNIGSNIKCEYTPKTIESLNTVIRNPDTQLPEVKIASLPLIQPHILYLDDEMIASIRSQNFTLSLETKYELLYRVSLIKLTEKKERLPLFFKIGYLSMIISVLSSEIAFLTWMEKKPHGIRQIQTIQQGMEIGAGSGLVSIASFLINKVTTKPVDPEQDRLDTIRRAHENAQSLISVPIHCNS